MRRQKGRGNADELYLHCCKSMPGPAAFSFARRKSEVSVYKNAWSFYSPAFPVSWITSTP